KEDPDGFLWIATDVNGLSRFLPAENGIDGTYIVYSEKEGLARNHMWSICLDAQSNLWIGTEDRGLCKVSLSNTREPEQFTLYTTQQGLSDDHVRSILADTNPAESDQLWASTLNGLNQVTFGSNHDQPVIIRSIQKTEGLKRSDFTFRSMALDQNGKLWVGTEEGLEVVEPSSFTASTINPKPKLKQLDLDGHYVQFRNHDEKNQKGITFQELEPYQNYPLNPEFSYHHHHLTFHFSAIDWTAPSKIQYTYNMEGVDQDWSSISAESKADYRNLPSGTHTFKVCAIGESQQWSEPFEYTFTIRPPWWYSWWAVVMYSLLGGFVLYRTYRFQLDRKLEIAEKQKLVELDRVKNRLYTNITHE
ncbi:MAG TPA: two-component regulator propeller domain-containing protein, partial [Saprospiraceae bacterium]|nr:two-component regulator propeller domain-containing protein [Saprospiraceae bacterium]